MISKTDLQIPNYLVGFHTFQKDHNYPNFKGNLINDFSKTLDDTILDAYTTGPLTILRSTSRGDLFEIKLGANVLIYQDSGEYDVFVKKAFELFENWKKYSNFISLKLVGLVTHFIFIPEKSFEKQNIFLSSYFKELNFVKSVNTNSINIRFKTDIDKDEYSVHLLVTDNQQELYGSVDVYKQSESKESVIKEEEISKIFSNSKSFFENQFIELINKGL